MDEELLGAQVVCCFLWSQMAMGFNQQPWWYRYQGILCAFLNNVIE